MGLWNWLFGPIDPTPEPTTGIIVVTEKPATKGAVRKRTTKERHEEWSKNPDYVKAYEKLETKKKKPKKRTITKKKTGSRRKSTKKS